MPKYLFTGEVKVCGSVEVTADNQEEAVAKLEKYEWDSHSFEEASQVDMNTDEMELAAIDGVPITE